MANDDILSLDLVLSLSMFSCNERCYTTQMPVIIHTHTHTATHIDHPDTDTPQPSHSYIVKKKNVYIYIYTRMNKYMKSFDNI